MPCKVCSPTVVSARRGGRSVLTSPKSSVRALRGNLRVGIQGAQWDNLEAMGLIGTGNGKGQWHP